SSVSAIQNPFVAPFVFRALPKPLLNQELAESTADLTVRGADGRTRTGTGVSSRGILSPLRLPFRHVRAQVGLLYNTPALPLRCRKRPLGRGANRHARACRGHPRVRCL